MLGLNAAGLKTFYTSNIRSLLLYGSSTVCVVYYPKLLDTDWSISKKFLNGPISIEYRGIRSSSVEEGLLYVNH